MPLRIVAAHFHAIAGRWIACYPFEIKRARGWFILDGDKVIDFANTHEEAIAIISTKQAA
jgi:hypothetical protein